ncbi:MAG: fibronectin type III domain-containing protein [Chitinispirillaceae bacterium]|nr:fibronectin type III domain-containing protein [Chitinispirillaceae bacterium]
MIKKSCVSAVMGIVFSAWASKASVTEVDAVSQATVRNNLKFNLPIYVTSDSAIITWTITKGSSGNHELSWGEASADLTSRAVTSEERSNKTVKLSGLSPNTAYKIRLEVTHPQNTKTPCADTATITTNPGTFAARRSSTESRIPPELRDRLLRLGSSAMPNDRVIIADCKGRTLLDHTVRENERSVALPSRTKGVYFLIYRRHGTLLDKRRLVIIQR